MCVRSGRKNRCPPIWIAVFGPDGAGKTAVIERATVQLAPGFCQILQFHFRPDFGRNASQQPVTDPHGQPPRTLLISIAKLIYWLLDCWYGHFIFVTTSGRSSRLVIFDRYYSDILVDARRYRLPVSASRIAKWLVQCAPRPDLCILLDAPAEIVQSRKAEVSAAESERQRREYLAMFGRMKNHNLVLNATCSIDELAQQMCQAVLALASTPSFQETKALANANL